MQKQARLWLWVLGLVFVLAACSQPQGSNGTNPNVPPPPQTAVLKIAVAGVDAADVVLAKGQEVLFEGTVAGQKTLELGPGTYTLDGMPVSGMIDPSPMLVVLDGGSEVTAKLEYKPMAVEGEPGIARSLEVVSVVDDRGVDLPGLPERNINKDVMIYASQTEEAVCVTLQARDENGDPAAYVPIVVNIADGTWLDDRIAIVRGCAPGGSVGAMGFRDGLMTDAEGMVKFTLYATFGQDGYDYAYGIAKITAAAENSDDTNVLEEFKFYFYNIAHLWAGFDGEELVATGERTGASFERVNLFDPFPPEGEEYPNTFWIDTAVFSKQPQFRLDRDFWEKYYGGGFYIRYEIIEGADDVHFVMCDDPVSDTVCKDYDTNIGLQPNDDVGLEDLPISATVKATLVIVQPYGRSIYEFDLKDYTVTKTWIGSFLKIDKQIDHHVLTWYGPEHTLDAANAVPAGSVFTATVTLTATNEGNAPVYDVSIADQLPAELGVIESTLNPAGGTYDATNHVVTWNYQTAGGYEPKFNQLDPGESITVTFQIYVRQKPGFCVDPEDLAAAKFYAVPFMFGYDNDGEYCYEDPYFVVNGAQQRDVTASWFTGAHEADGGFQAVVDFNGWFYEEQAIVWAVRPIFDIDKVLSNTQDWPFQVGTDAFFDITLYNLDRPEYGALMAKYPAEFDGSVRDNPYGRDVKVGDGFLLGLDFNTTNALTLVDDDGVNPDQDFAPNAAPGDFLGFADKSMFWATIPLMGGGDVASTTLVLENNLPGIHVNVAGATAANMNQYTNNCKLPRADMDASAVDMPEIPFRNALVIDCAWVYVLEPTDPWIELNNLGNWESFFFDPEVKRGEDFYYLFEIKNSGTGTAEDVTLVIELDNANATILGGSSSHTTVAAFDGSSLSFAPFDLAPGDIALFAVVAHANAVGNNSATATVDYANPDTQAPLVPYSTVETVSIQPPF